MVKEFVAVLLVSLLSGGWSLCAQGASPEQTAQRLSEASEQVRIVGFGDSITGIYYHSGGKRAWPEMLEIALKKLYPDADIDVANAGISGNTTAQGLVRMQADVLDRNPHLVVIMFGMNDLAYGTVTPEQDAAKKAAFVANLGTMVTNCHAANAEVILCSQNPVYPEAASARPPERVSEFAALIRQTGADLGVPVVDVYTEWDELRTTDLRAWRLLMSETIHPSMAGHKRMAEQMAETIAGRAVSLADVLPDQPVCASLIDHLKMGEPVKLMVSAAMAPTVASVVSNRYPSASFTIVSMPEGSTADAFDLASRSVRGQKPSFVLLSPVPDILTFTDEEHYVREISWAVNYALPFAGSEWSVVCVDPSLLNPGLTAQQQEGLLLFKAVAQGHDIDWIAQPAGAQSSTLAVALDSWFEVQEESDKGPDVPLRTLELPPGADNSRNSEGAFVTLADGRILFVYTYFTDGGGDHDPAHLAGRTSSDGGMTWTEEDQVIVANEGDMNVMSVSLLRLKNGNIALFYLLKNGEQDCRPVMRLSTDEGATWGAPVSCITDQIGYYVLNNDRAVQLTSGRLVLPVALHWVQGAPAADWNGTLMCYLSDDNGATWRRSITTQQGYNASGTRITTQEPGVVELKDGRVMMFIRTNGGCQYLAWSSDRGDTWSAPVASDIKSPLSPASIKRLPPTGDLLLVWNDHANIPDSLSSRRVPLSTAISKDDGKSWQHIKVLEGNPQGWYCYIAIHPMADAVLLGYCAMSGLAHSRITRVPMEWFEEPRPAVISFDAPGTSVVRLYGYFKD